MPVGVVSASPQAAGGSGHVVLYLGVLLLVAVGMGWLARRAGLPVIVGELAAGVLLGPSLLGAVAPGDSGWLPTGSDQAHLFDTATQLGAVLLVGVTGGELSLRAITQRGRSVAAVCLGGLLVPLALGVVAGYLVPRDLWGPGADQTTFAWFLGAALCVSAIPVIAKTLSDLKMVHRNVGQLILTAAALEGLVAWLMVAALSAVVAQGWQPAVLARVVFGLLGFVVLVVLGRPLVRFVLRAAARTNDPVPINAVCVTFILLAAAASQAVGLEAIFGALVAGMLISSTAVVPPGTLAPLRTFVLAVCAPIFLAGAGLRMDLTALGGLTDLLTALVILVLAIVGKLVGAYVGARIGRLGHWEGVALGVGLNSRGLVEIVIAETGLRIGVLSTTAYTIIVLVAVCTSALAPPLLRWSMVRVEYRAEESARAAEPSAWKVADQVGSQRE
jgi:Kef-type K+ transport system membrane component KefB